MADSTINDRLREALIALSLRERQEIRPEELARRVSEISGESVDRSTVHRWIAGTMDPPMKRMDALSRVLGVDPAWLAWGEMVDLSWLNVDTREEVKRSRKSAAKRRRASGE